MIAVQIDGQICTTDPIFLEGWRRSYPQPPPPAVLRAAGASMDNSRACLSLKISALSFWEIRIEPDIIPYDSFPTFHDDALFLSFRI